MDALNIRPNKRIDDHRKRKRISIRLQSNVLDLNCSFILRALNNDNSREGARQGEGQSPSRGGDATGPADDSARAIRSGREAVRTSDPVTSRTTVLHAVPNKACAHLTIGTYDQPATLGVNPMTGQKMPRLKQQRSIETREAILSGAARVFSRVTYAEARYRDVAVESGASEGALYFHFRSKADLASAVLDGQQERMTAVLVDAETQAGSGLQILLRLVANLGDLIAHDEVVQAGIRLAGQPSSEVVSEASEPYTEWVRIARALIDRGIADGSIRSDIDPDLYAELLNTVFVGSQVLSGLEDQWASLPQRLKRLAPVLKTVLAP